VVRRSMRNTSPWFPPPLLLLLVNGTFLRPNLSKRYLSDFVIFINSALFTCEWTNLCNFIYAFSNEYLFDVNSKKKFTLNIYCTRSFFIAFESKLQ